MVSKLIYKGLVKTEGGHKVILGVQYLRGLAALGVVLCHYGSDIKPYPALSKVFNYGQNGVYVFFLISGFIIVYSLTKANYKVAEFFRFILKRSIRIDPPYLVSIILTLLLFKLLTFSGAFKGAAIPFIPQQFIAHVFYAIPFTRYEFYNHVYWTLSVEFQFYILIGLLYFISSSKVYKTCFLLVFSLTCLINLPNSYYLIFTYAPIFCLGISLVNILQYKSAVSILLGVFFVSVIAYKFGVALALLLVICSVVIFAFNKFNKVLFWLGEISYSLYLIHVLVFIVAAGMLKRLNANLDQHQLMWMLLEIFIAIAAAHLYYSIVEKPFLRYSKKIFYNKD